MKFSILDTIDPHYNLAVEEYLFNTSSEEVFLLWQNSPTVVIGKNQNAFAEINKPVLEKNGVIFVKDEAGKFAGLIYSLFENLFNFFFDIVHILLFLPETLPCASEECRGYPF